MGRVVCKEGEEEEERAFLHTSAEALEEDAEEVAFLAVVGELD